MTTNNIINIKPNQVVNVAEYLGINPDILKNAPAAVKIYCLREAVKRQLQSNK